MSRHGSFRISLDLAPVGLCETGDWITVEGILFGHATTFIASAVPKHPKPSLQLKILSVLNICCYNFPSKSTTSCILCVPYAQSISIQRDVPFQAPHDFLCLKPSGSGYECNPAVPFSQSDPKSLDGITLLNMRDPSASPCLPLSSFDHVGHIFLLRVPHFATALSLMSCPFTFHIRISVALFLSIFKTTSSLISCFGVKWFTLQALHLLPRHKTWTPPQDGTDRAHIPGLLVLLPSEGTTPIEV